MRERARDIERYRSGDGIACSPSRRPREMPSGFTLRRSVLDSVVPDCCHFSFVCCTESAYVKKESTKSPGFSVIGALQLEDTRTNTKQIASDGKKQQAPKVGGGCGYVIARCLCFLLLNV